MQTLNETMSLRRNYSREAVPPVRRTQGKELALSLLSLAIGVLSWWLTIFVAGNNIIEFNDVSLVKINMNTLTVSSLAALVFALHGAFFIFTASLVKNTYFVPLILLMSVLPAVFLLGNGFPLILIGTIVYLAGLLSSRFFMKRALQNQQTFSLYGMVRGGAGVLITVMLINISLIYYVDVSSSTESAEAISASTVGYTVPALNKILERILNGYSPSMTVDAFIENVSGVTSGTKNSGDENALNPGINSLFTSLGLPNSGAELIENQREQARAQFFESLGIDGSEFTGMTPITKVWEAFVKERIASSLVLYKRFIPLIAALGLFFTLVIFTFLYKWFIFFFAWLILYIFITTKFFRWEEVMVPQKRLTL